MKKVLILSTDTPHHRYFINTLYEKGVVNSPCIFETTHVTAPFTTGPFLEEEQKAFEREHFFQTVPFELLPEVVMVKNINEADSIDKIKAIAPDFAVSFGVRKILPQVIGLFGDGIINVHRGIAQQYRGLDSDLWAIYHRDYENTGVTIHCVAPELDTGEIVFQQCLTLKQNMQIHHLCYYSTVIATELVAKALKDYHSGCLKTFPQEKLGRYYSFMPLDLKRQMAKRFNTYCETLND